MIVVETPQTRCRAAIAACDITPPVGIYHRMWGAAAHEQATGVHQPLLATLLWLEPLSGDWSQAVVIVALDHCVLDRPDVERMQRSVAETAAIGLQQVVVTLSHTHAAGLLSQSRSPLPGGELIGPYLDEAAAKLAGLAASAKESRHRATIIYGRGHCDLATHRDFFDARRQQHVCGFNPGGPADDTLLVAKVVTDDGRLLATIVNYACHPTTLAWQNTLISPDYVGALRETVEAHLPAPCLFLQGASGDLGPRDGFVGDPAVAERNGRRLAFAALSALEGLPPPQTRFAYGGPVVSGAVIGTWRHEILDDEARRRIADWHSENWELPLHYKAELPTVPRTAEELAKWEAEERAAAAAGDGPRARECRARAEQARRQLWRLRALPAERFPLPITVAKTGDAIWLFIAGEHYQSLQTTLRNRFPGVPIIIATLSNGWQPGYVPPASAYGRGIYQEQIAVVAAGSAEEILASISRRIEAVLASA